MKLHRLTIWMLATAALAACSTNDGAVEPPVEPECPAATPLTIEVPAGFPELPNPKSNPLTVEGVALGRRLFYDPILSGDSSQACGTCHVQVYGFGDPRRFSEGIHGVKGNRNAPAIVNPGWTGETFWDGRTSGLEDQAKAPVPNPIEMDLPWPAAIERLERHPEYPDLFCAAFGDREITVGRVVRAIAQFERTFVSADSKYDRVRRGEATFTPEELAGYRIFNTEVGDCFHCHMEPLFTVSTVFVGADLQFRNTGLDSVIVDNGRGEVTGNPADNGKFKIPSLRNITDTMPYMHDGRFTNLRQVIEHYNHGFHDSDDVDPLIRARLTRRAMRTGEIDTLITFLETLTDGAFMTDPDLSSPFPGTTAAPPASAASR
jgi:cytochrome c peroxidase